LFTGILAQMTFLYFGSCRTNQDHPAEFPSRAGVEDVGEPRSENARGRHPVDAQIDLAFGKIPSYIDCSTLPEWSVRGVDRNPTVSEDGPSLFFRNIFPSELFPNSPGTKSQLREAFAGTPSRRRATGACRAVSSVTAVVVPPASSRVCRCTG